MEPLHPDLLRGSLELMVLSVVSEGPAYGYSIQQRLRDVSGNMVDVSAGTLYPVLHRLEKDGAIKARWEQSTGRPRKWYELTASGRKRLSHRARIWQEYVACVRRVIQASPEIASQPV